MISANMVPNPRSPQPSYDPIENTIRGDIRRYVNSYDEKQKLRIIEGMQRSGHSSVFRVIGDMFLDLAFNASDTHTRNHALRQASDSWYSALKTSAREGQYTYHTHHAQRGLVYLPFFSALLHYDTLAVDEPVRKSAYHRLIQSGVHAEQALASFAPPNRKMARIKNWSAHNLSGAIAELNVLLLSQRHVNKNDDGLQPLPALLSNDASTTGTDGQQTHEGWDLSLMRNGSNGSPELAHKVQVKSWRNRSGPDYDDGITVVYSREDLALSDHERHDTTVGHIGFIIRECLDEAFSTNPRERSVCAANLDRRTEKLFAIIG